MIIGLFYDVFIVTNCIILMIGVTNSMVNLHINHNPKIIYMFIC